jgi:hypothetical protein
LIWSVLPRRIGHSGRFENGFQDRNAQFLLRHRRRKKFIPQIEAGVGVAFIKAEVSDKNATEVPFPCEKLRYSGTKFAL